MNPPVKRNRTSCRRTRTTRRLIVEFREIALTRNELARILNRNAVRIRRIGNKLPSDNRWHIEIPFHGPGNLSRAIRKLDRLPGVTVSAREKGLPS